MKLFDRLFLPSSTASVAEPVTDRSALDAEREQLQARMASINSEFETRRVERLARAEEHRRALQAIAAEGADDTERVHQLLWPLERRVAAIERQLYSTRSAGLFEAFREAIAELHDATTQARDSVRSRSLDGFFRVTWSNGPSIERRREAIGELSREVRSWQTQSLSDDEMRERFERRVAALPAIERRPGIAFEPDAARYL